MKSILHAIGLMVAAASSSAALAAPVYVAQVSIVPSEGTSFFDGGTPAGIATTASGFVNAPINHVSAPGIEVTGLSYGDATAFAGLGTLAVYSRASQTAQGGTLDYYLNRIRTESRASFMLDDLVVTPVNPNNPQQFVGMTLRFAISGLMPDPDAQGQVYDTATRTTFPDQTFATVDDWLSLDVGFRDPAGVFTGFGGGFARIMASATNAVGSTGPFMTTNGALGGQGAALQSGATFIAEALFGGVPVGVPLELTVGMRATTESVFGFPQNGGLWQGNGVVQFDHTLTFATDAVATLPAGFTLNSASGQISNNVWTPVPLPGTLLLLLTAFLAASTRRHGRGLAPARSAKATTTAC